MGLDFGSNGISRSFPWTLDLRLELLSFPLCRVKGRSIDFCLDVSAESLSVAAEQTKRVWGFRGFRVYTLGSAGTCGKDIWSFRVQGFKFGASGFDAVGKVFLGCPTYISY